MAPVAVPFVTFLCAPRVSQYATACPVLGAVAVCASLGEAFLRAITSRHPPAPDEEKTMRLTHALRLSLAVVALALLSSIAYAEEKKEEAKKSAVDGVWVWEARGQNNQTRAVKLTLKQEGEKLTGYLPGP